MTWESIFNRKNNTSLAKAKRIYRALKIKPRAKILSVVGTNGKGSVVSNVAQGLIADGRKVGIFTSPHILKPNERIKINNKQITNKEAFEIIKILPNDIHFFATMFLTAMIWFNKNDVDVIILEAGIGGKEDTTNVIRSDYGVVTSIGWDHQNILGNTLNSIAKQKAGIINSGITFFIPTQLKESLQEVFVDKIMRTKSASFRMINNLSRSYKQRNKMLSHDILKLAFGIDFDNFEDLPGRTQLIEKKGVQYIYDVGHNISAFKEVLKELARTRIDFKNVVICMSKKKKKEGVVELFKGKKVFIYQLNNSFWSPKEFKTKELKEPWKFKSDQNTLFIGSFYFIEKLWKKQKKS